MNKWSKRLEDNLVAEFKSNKKLTTHSNTKHSSNKVQVLPGETGNTTKLSYSMGSRYNRRQ